MLTHYLCIGYRGKLCLLLLANSLGYVQWCIQWENITAIQKIINISKRCFHFIQASYVRFGFRDIRLKITTTKIDEKIWKNTNSQTNFNCMFRFVFIFISMKILHAHDPKMKKKKKKEWISRIWLLQNVYDRIRRKNFIKVTSFVRCWNWKIYSYFKFCGKL